MYVYMYVCTYVCKHMFVCEYKNQLINNQKYSCKVWLSRSLIMTKHSDVRTVMINSILILLLVHTRPLMMGCFI